MHHFEHQVLLLTNNERSKIGLPPLHASIKLIDASRIRAEELIVLEPNISFYMDHLRPDGSNWHTVLNQVSLELSEDYTYARENIGSGFRTAEEMVDGWMNSRGHRANILDPRVVYLGVGIALDEEDRIHWVQIFSD
jgi:uncharacterized protein YkwD